jgi:glycogen debranching enzyme
MNDVLQDEDRYQILARSSLSARVLKHDETFGVFDRAGDIRPSGVLGYEGLYHEGARFLSKLRVRLGHDRLLILSSTVEQNNVVLAADLTNPDITQNGIATIPHGALHVLRSKFLWDATCHEHLQITNFGATAVDVGLQVEFAADFADIFEVRGTSRSARGKAFAPAYEDGDVLLAYVGLDGVARHTRIHFAPYPEIRDEGSAEFRLQLDAKQTKDVYITVSCEVDPTSPRQRPAFENARKEASAARHPERDACRIRGSNETWNAWMGRSRSDLRMLTTQTERGPYPYAGVPWFSTPFGRDGIITALSTLWFDPSLARGVLEFLAHTQAEHEDPKVDAEPGKIVHELRLGEMAALGEIPFGRYYGSVDATPLFVVLCAAYYEATADLAFAKRMAPHVERALGWMERADVDDDGFLEYDRRSHDGLVQQGWKDSNDSVFHADGTLAEGPVALCEVQAYAYAALRGGAMLAQALGRPERCSQLLERADRLQQRFDDVFWCDDLCTYALALDGHKHACRVRSSNAGHCLLMGIALPSRALALAEQLLAPEMFSGWGIRTLATTERRYNPMSYHNGSIWPHDNAMIAAGLARYGLKHHALRVASALFDASVHVDLHRLPELFCGFPRRSGEGPTQYPVACSPQAWASGAAFLLLQASLGVRVDAVNQRLTFHYSNLPDFLDLVRIENLPVGSARVDLDLHRYPDAVGINVLRREGRVEVVSIK